MKKTRKKIIVGILLATLLSQTLYSAASGIFGVSAQSYAYADDEMAEDVEPGEFVDESTMDDSEEGGEVAESSTEEAVEETTEEATEAEADQGMEEVDAQDDALIDAGAGDVGEEEEVTEEAEEEEAEEIRLTASYVDSDSGAAIKDSEDLIIDTNYMFVIRDEAPEIENYTYDKTTINIEDTEYDITAILTEDVEGTEVYSYTTDEDIADKNADEISWTQLTEDTEVVFNYKSAEEEQAEETVSENEVEEEAEKRVYEFEDDKIKVTATLERADAVPDDAYFAVTPLTEEEADKYIASLNENLEEGQPEVTKDDILLYDIAFYADESRSEEIEPEEGSVTVSIEFKTEQISEELGVENDEDINVTHFEENGNNIDAVTVEADTSADNNTVDFTTDSFSVYGIWANRVVKNLKPGATATYSDALGEAVKYGVVANDMHLDGHMETNFAVGAMHGEAQIQSCKNEGGGAGRVFIGSYDDNSKKFLMDKNSNAGLLYIYTTADVLNRMDPAMKSRSGVVVDTHSYSESQIKSMVKGMVDSVRTKSDELMEEENCYQYSGLWKNQWDKTVDLTDSSNPGGTYYISFDTSDGKSENKFPESGYEIRIRSDQNLVFNIPDKKIYIGQYKLYIDGKDYTPQGNSDESVLFEKIIFNCPNAEEVHTSTPVTGTFLVPRGDFWNDSVAAGFLVANNIRKIGGAEWHCISKDIEIVEDGKTSIDLKLKKSLKDDKEQEVSNDQWPDEGFTFKVSKYTGNDNGDINSGIITDKSKIPTIPGMNSNGEMTVTVNRDTPDHEALIGTLEFKGQDIWNQGSASPNPPIGYGPGVHCISFMYKITEVKGTASGIQYDADPYYIKIFVNCEKQSSNGVTRYIVWTETKSNRNVTEYSCEPKTPEFINHKVEQRSFKVTKNVNSSRNEDLSRDYYFELFRKANGASTYDPVVSVTSDGKEEWFQSIKNGQTVEIVGYKLNGQTVTLRNDEDYYIVEHDNKYSNGKYGPPEGFEASYRAEGTQYTIGKQSGTNVDVIQFRLGSGDTNIEIMNTRNARGDLRIHKTVVNDFGSEEVRNNSNSALNQVLFVVTNLDHKVGNENFQFTLDGYVGRLGTAGEVKGNDGVTYKVTYDQNAHWTIYDLPAGRYTVQEIADGVVIPQPGELAIHPEYTKVTKYSLADYRYYDKDARKRTQGNYWWASDDPNQIDDYSQIIATVGPGVEVQCVQVYNYYSQAQAELKATKDYNGNVWPSEGFTFELSPVGAFDKSGNKLNKTVPMPESNTAVATKDAPTVSFGTIRYPEKDYEETVYKYQIKETVNGATEVTVGTGSNAQTYWLKDGILYDKTVHDVEVYVHLTKGTFYKASDQAPGGDNPAETFYGIVADVSYPTDGANAESAVFTNKESKPVTYKPWAVKTTKYVPSGETKTLKFQLIDEDEKRTVQEKTVKVKGTGSWFIDCFDELTYYGEGVHHYRVVETDSNGAVSVTPAEGITFTVTVSYNADGSLKVSSTNDDRTANQDARKITNIYPMNGKASVRIQKKITGRKFTADDEFWIDVTKNGKTWKSFKAGSGSDISNIDVEFDAFDQDSAQDYVTNKKSDLYEFKERDTKQPGITYDKTVYTAKVTPSIVDGKIEINVEKSANDIVFINTYDATGSLDLETKKVFVGNKALTADLFKFDLVKDGEVLQTKGNDADGKVTFDKINYTLANDAGKIYTYVVREQLPEEATAENDYTVNGIKYDTRTYTVKASITDNGDGTLGVNTSGAIEALKSTGFNNTYDEKGELSFKVKKSINKWPKDKTFTFKLYDGSTQVGSDIVLSAAKTESDPIKVTADASEAGKVHDYKLVEVAPREDSEGIEYDRTAKIYSVTWTSDGKGKLEPVYNGQKVEAGQVLPVTFTNKYNAGAAFEPKVTKTITGMTLTKPFSFEFTDDKGNVIDTKTIGGEANSKKYSDTATFAAQTYTLADDGKTFTYHIHEVIPEGAVDNKLDGITYDDTDHEIKVTLADNGKGSLVKKVTLDGVAVSDDAVVNVQFNNEYTTAGKVVLHAQKVVTAGNKPLPADKLDLNNRFEFELKDANGVQIGKTKKTDATGLVTFDEILYTAEGTYTYTITEISEDKDGFVKKIASQEVTVEVTDKGDGTLEARPTYDTDFPVIENEFSANAKVDLGGTKTLEGRASEDKTFTFDLIPAEGQIDADKNAKSASVTYTAGETGSKPFAFDDLTYDLSDLGGATEKTLYYSVTERAVEGGVVQEGTKEYAMQVVLKLEGGKLKAEETVKAIPDENKGFWATLKDKVFNGDNDSVLFKNKYEASGKIPLEGVKSFAKSDDDMSLAGFTFEVKLGGQVVATGISDADGKITYTVAEGYGQGNELKYTSKDIGTKEYTVTEGKKDGFIAVASRTFKVTIADNGNGTLSVTSDDKQQALSFVNTPTELNISKKDFSTGAELKGAALKLVDSEGRVVKEWTSDGTYKTIYGLKAGTYTLKETNRIAGYEVAQEATVVLSEDNKVEVKDSKDIVKAADGSVTNLIVVNNRVRPITVKKVDANSPETVLTGAEYTVTELDGTALPDGAVEDSMKSDGTMTLKGLATGKTYKITEKKAPDGYAKAADVEFEIQSDRKIKITSGDDHANVSGDSLNITIADPPTRLYLAKYDGSASTEENKVLLKDAKLEIRKGDANGEAVKTGLTSSATEKIEITRLTPGDYTLVETEAPKGYLVADPVAFTIDEYGKVYINGNEAPKDADGTYLVSMYDTKIGELVFSGQKIWVDGEDQQKVRPERIKVALQRKLATDKGWTEPNFLTVWATKDSEDPYSFVFNNEVAKEYGKSILKTNEFGVAYEYQILEELDTNTKERYLADNQGIGVTASNDGSGYVITNRLKPEVVDVHVHKTWQTGGVNKDDIYTGFVATLQMKDANGNYVDVKDSEGNVLSKPVPKVGDIIFAGLDKYDENGFEIVYRVVETNKSNTYYWNADGSITQAEGTDRKNEEDTPDGVIDLDLLNDHPDLKPGEVVIEGKKKVLSTTGVGKDLSGFTFGLYELKDGNYVAVDGVPAVTTTNAETGEFKFATIKYEEDQIGDYTYYIKEDAKAGFTADVDDNGTELTDKYHPVYVHVAYGPDKKSIIATATYGPTSAVITNRYDAEGEVTIKVTKSMTTWPAGAEFRVKVTDSVTDSAFAGEVKEPKYVTLTEANPVGSVKFTGYTKAAEHVYTLAEVDGNDNVLSGKTVDNVVYGTIDPVTVTFTDTRAKTDNILDAVVDGKEVSEIERSVENGYGANGEFAPEVKKILNGKTMDPEEFGFELKDADGNVLQTKYNDKNGKVVFDKIGYTLADLDGAKEKEFKYYIREVPGTNPGMKYDISGIENHEITFTLYDDGKGGLIKKDLKGLVGNILTITNEYSTKGEVQFAAMKTVKTPSGKTLPYNQIKRTFEFKITATDPAGKIVTETGEKDYITAKTDESGLAQFADKIKYTKEGTYTYTIEETTPDGAGYTKPESQTITVVMTDAEKNGTLTPTVTFSGDGFSAFTNVYGADGGIDVTAAKVYDDYDYPAGGFKLYITDKEGGKQEDAIGGVQTITKAEDIAKWHFDYTEDDLFVGDEYQPERTRTYYIYEVDERDKNPQIDYEGAKKYAKVTVTIKDNKDGTLGVTKDVEYEGVAPDQTQSFIDVLLNKKPPVTADAYFRNYVKRTGSLQFDAVKLLQYVDGSLVQPTKEVQEQMKLLRFEVTENGQPVIAEDNTPNVGTIDISVEPNGNVKTQIKFKEIKYDAPGRHTYTIKETGLENIPVEKRLFDIDKAWKDGKSFTVDVKDPEVISKDNYGKLVVTMSSGDANTFSILDNKISFIVHNPWIGKIKVTKRFLGVDAEHPINKGVRLRLARRLIFGIEQSVDPDEATAGIGAWYATPDENDSDQNGWWTVRTADESRTFTGLPKGKYRLYEEVSDDCKFTNEEVVKNGGYVDLEVDEDGCLTSTDNPAPRDEYVLNNKAENTKELYFKLIKTWRGKANELSEVYDHVTVRISRTKQPLDMEPGDKPEVFEETIITDKGQTAKEHTTNKYAAQYWSERTGKYENYIYDIEENPVPGYTAYEGSYEGISYNGIKGNRTLGSQTGDVRYDTVRFLNIVTNIPVEIPVEKRWVDHKRADARPAIRFHLFADSGKGEKEINTYVLNPGTTSFTFTKDKDGKDLQKYDAANDYKLIKYRVTEEPVPGYKPGTVVQDADGKWIFTNESIQTEIKKYDVNDGKAVPTALEGAEFTINESDKDWKIIKGGWSASFKSGQTLEVAIGSASGGIRPGYYVMTETKAPKGYALNSQQAHFIVEEDGTVTQKDSWVKANWDKKAICFADDPLYGEFRIIKVDGEDEAPLEGAEFKLYSNKAYKSGSRVLSNYIAGEDVLYELGTYVSGSDGRIVIKDLEWGTYYLEETKAPLDYVLPEHNVFIFDVDETHNTPGSDDYLELHYIANDKTPPPPPGSSSSSSTTSSSTSTTSSTSSTSSTTTTSSSTRTATSSASSSGRYLTGVLGERKGGLLSDVLGVKKGPQAGVLGERMSPVTGDDLTLNFWIMILGVAGLIGMSFVYSDDEEEEENGDGTKKKKRKLFGRAKAKAEK
ncbi:MAG: Cna B-type domain-containing protein [Lachnospiraceae bacterium]|nr:Cna B-type domain-containing protein [Lachnospiraceae bacterium]